MNHNAQVLKRIKENYTNNKHRRNLRLPSKQGYTFIGDAVEIKLKKGVESENMQEDASAFEGWALVVKHWGDFIRVELCWEIPKEKDNGHYQRFLYRVKQFSGINHAWFSVCDKNSDYLNDLKIKKNGDYVLNAPLADREIGNPRHREAILEKYFADNTNKLHTQLSDLTNADFIQRQLPVGVFDGKVKNENAIFTKGKSAIDLWGINKSNELLLFELKAEGNNKVGIISELFFYVCIMQGIINDIFKHEQIDKTLYQIPKVKGIKAYFLAYDLHPLIDDSIIAELNKMIPKHVEYHFIRIKEDDSLILEY